MKLRRTIYAVLLASESGLEIEHAGFDSDGLRDCQALAQRLTETNQGVATVGIMTFQPLTKLEQVEIAKSENTNRARRTSAICELVQDSA